MTTMTTTTTTTMSMLLWSERKPRSLQCGLELGESEAKAALDAVISARFLSFSLLSPSRLQAPTLPLSLTQAFYFFNSHPHKRWDSHSHSLSCRHSFTSCCSLSLSSLSLFLVLCLTHSLHTHTVTENQYYISLTHKLSYAQDKHILSVACLSKNTFLPICFWQHDGTFDEAQKISSFVSHSQIGFNCSRFLFLYCHNVRLIQSLTGCFIHFCHIFLNFLVGIILVDFPTGQLSSWPTPKSKMQKPKLVDSLSGNVPVDLTSGWFIATLSMSHGINPKLPLIGKCEL